MNSSNVERFDELKNLINSFETDFDKFYNRGNKAAGIRIRKYMQNLKNLTKTIRDEIQKINTENNSKD